MTLKDKHLTKKKYLSLAEGLVLSVAAHGSIIGILKHTDVLIGLGCSLCMDMFLKLPIVSNVQPRLSQTHHSRWAHEQRFLLLPTAPQVLTCSRAVLSIEMACESHL